MSDSIIIITARKTSLDNVNTAIVSKVDAEYGFPVFTYEVFLSQKPKNIVNCLNSWKLLFHCISTTSTCTYATHTSWRKSLSLSVSSPQSLWNIHVTARSH